MQRRVLPASVAALLADAEVLDRGLRLLVALAAAGVERGLVGAGLEGTAVEVAVPLDEDLAVQSVLAGHRADLFALVRDRDAHVRLAGEVESEALQRGTELRHVDA